MERLSRAVLGMLGGEEKEEMKSETAGVGRLRSFGAAVAKTVQGIQRHAAVLCENVNSAVKNQTANVESILRERTIYGNFLSEQEAFVRESADARREVDVVPPWANEENEYEIKKHCLALSQHESNLLREPPVGCDFVFNFSECVGQAIGALEADETLRKLRFALVPGKISEEEFWKNYFYRVSLIKKTANANANNANCEVPNSDVQDADAPRSNGHDLESKAFGDLNEYELVGDNDPQDWMDDLLEAEDEPIDDDASAVWMEDIAFAALGSLDGAHVCTDETSDPEKASLKKGTN